MFIGLIEKIKMADIITAIVVSFMCTLIYKINVYIKLLRILSFFLRCVLLVGFYVIFVFYRHYLLVLLGLEFVMLSVFLFVCLGVGFYCSGVGKFLFLLVLVCMGGFGVSVLVFVSRGYGRDDWKFGIVK
jgi:hypothetical protein